MNAISVIPQYTRPGALVCCEPVIIHCGLETMTPFYCHDTVVYLSIGIIDVGLSVTKSIVAKRYILQQAATE